VRVQKVTTFFSSGLRRWAGPGGHMPSSPGFLEAVRFPSAFLLALYARTVNHLPEQIVQHLQRIPDRVRLNIDDARGVEARVSVHRTPGGDVDYLVTLTFHDERHSTILYEMVVRFDAETGRVLTVAASHHQTDWKRCYEVTSMKGRTLYINIE
jgi:hypothetical protein